MADWYEMQVAHENEARAHQQLQAQLLIASMPYTIEDQRQLMDALGLI